MAVQVMITRAEPGASKTAERLAGLGFAPLSCPALELVFHDPAGFIPPSSNEACIFTSANGVRAAQNAGWTTSGLAICVGEATRLAAERAGYANTMSAEGDSDAVLELICSSWHAEGAPCFVHIANENAAGSLVARLNACKFAARFLPVYGTRPVSWALASHLCETLQPDAIILIHSAKGAEAVASWLEEGAFNPSGMRLVGLSERAIAPLRHMPFLLRRVALQPNETELIKSLQSVAEPGVT